MDGVSTTISQNSSVVVTGGRWQVAGGRWQVAGGRWQVANGRFNG